MDGLKQRRASVTATVRKNIYERRSEKKEKEKLSWKVEYEERRRRKGNGGRSKGKKSSGKTVDEKRPGRDREKGKDFVLLVKEIV